MTALAVNTKFLIRSERNPVAEGVQVRVINISCEESTALGELCLTLYQRKVLINF